jgi:hypothetical protein
MAYKITTQGQAITVINALRKATQDVASTPEDYVADVENLFTLLLGSASPKLNSTEAYNVTQALRAATLGNSDVPSVTQSYVNTIGSLLLGTTVKSTVLQAQLVFNRIYYAYLNIAGDPAHQVLDVNNLIASLQAL